MRAVVFEEFGGPVRVREVPEPAVPRDGVVVRVEATGLCRSDWHGWLGHDPDITLPHVPGHELAGVVEAAGPGVTRWRPGDRVTVPFVCACGRCPACARGDQQVCENQQQPGFTHWGSYAQYVALHQADVNLVALPDGMAYATAAALGCRFATAYRAVVSQGRARPGTWVAVHGCGGVGLSAIMIAAALGARVVAVDTSAAALERARALGAAVCVDAADTGGDTAAAVREATGGGAHVSLDALGSARTCAASVAGLRVRGRHVQVGLLPGGATAVPMDRVVALELELLGSHGMAAHAYPEMMRQVAAGVLRPDLLLGDRIGLDEAPAALTALSDGSPAGITVIEPPR
ncbi:zinc-dependent alcohol dehydrogenase family protein [Actinacidiphila acidipaludis]|uniref:2-deoxy-scyllo-inosamine dehydrogenase n=1 Tax=Actinacidiphila acidipaludis TaxID=2873382 RepID=A0ABS7Q6I2_9ACTN|nr:zinc-dependent alcohol dehydrogenase family protein [Streptomyces acidipaludis]MBY8878461.1 zinc-dependent alcohol dehydrogenase family protein [Streptomyces acidipaludis]